jgi:hypothetical protein
LAFIPQVADRITPSEAAVREHVVNSLKRAIQRETAITEATELHYDLGLAGEDLADAIEAIREPFGTDFGLMDLRQFAPNEVTHNFGLNLVREFRERRGDRTYRSLTVSNLFEAIQFGSWNDGYHP